MKHSSQHSIGSSASMDDNLIAIALRFENGLREWFDFVRQSGLSGYDDHDAGASAEKLRRNWGHDLTLVKSIAPQTLRGALAKVSAARAHLEFTSELDADASAFLALTVRELDHLARHDTDDLPQNNRDQMPPRRSPWLFDFLGLRS